MKDLRSDQWRSQMEGHRWRDGFGCVSAKMELPTRTVAASHFLRAFSCGSSPEDWVGVGTGVDASMACNAKTDGCAPGLSGGQASVSQWLESSAEALRVKLLAMCWRHVGSASLSVYQ